MLATLPRINEPGGSQNDPLGLQNALQNGGKTPQNRLKLAPGTPWDPPWAYLALILHPGVHFGAHFGTPKEAKIHQKCNFLCLKPKKEATISRFGGHACFFTPFSPFLVIWGRFLEVKTLTKTYIYIYIYIYIYVFVGFSIFKKNNPFVAKKSPKSIKK